MKIEPIAEGRLRVWLKPEEAALWKLDREEPDRMGLRRLVRRVYAAAGCRPVGRLTVEMVPVADGWLLLISPSASLERGPVVYHLANADDLLSLWERWRSAIDASPAFGMLYEMPEGYRLTLYPESPLTQREWKLLAEHAQLVGRGEAVAAHTAEYGNIIATGNVLTADGHRPPELSGREN